MRIAVLGGGPGGLYAAALAKQLDPSREVTVWERNAADDTFGFGVVFSEETLDGIAAADPQIFARLEEEFATWSDIDIHYRGSVQTAGGHGFAAISRKRLLQILQRRCADLGVDVRFRTAAPPVEELSAAYDLVIAADGVNSATRAAYSEVFSPSLDVRGSRFMWLGTDRVLESFTFITAETEFGPLTVHGYPFSSEASTFIVEVNEQTWLRAGFDRFAAREYPPGESDHDSIALCERLLGGFLDGHRLLSNNSKWVRFTTVRNRTWRHGNIVLLGDAAHTAHFSIGSGTKLAMEDAMALAGSLERFPGDVPAALDRYERERKPVVESTQRAAQASLEWFENIEHAVGQEPEQFAFNLLTRSRRVTFDNLRLRDPEYAGSVEHWFGQRQKTPSKPAPALFQPFPLGGLVLPNRVVAAPMASYEAADGIPGERELIHLGSRALGGAGLVLTGMTAVSPQGRITSACPGLYTDEQTAAWRRITDFVHTHSSTAVGVQLGHSGRRGSTLPPGSGGAGAVADDAGWETVGPSPIPYGTLPAPRELDEAGLAAVVAEFREAARRADAAGFDVLEIQAGHGFLLSTFLSPLTNFRDDRYGGALENRLRFPLAVLDEVRAVWPDTKPLLVRISAYDWVAGGTTLDEAAAIATAFGEHGADAIDVSSGEVVAEEKPAYGRSYQTPFAAHIRSVTGVPTIAVGGISNADDANSIILAGRSDLVAVGAAYLHDPNWVLHAAAELGHTGADGSWPAAFATGIRRPPAGRRERTATVLRPAGVVRRRWRATGSRSRA
ncbi:oxidoreductase [Streptomyces sp. NPDC004838]